MGGVGFGRWGGGWSRGGILFEGEGEGCWMGM